MGRNRGRSASPAPRRSEPAPQQQPQQQVAQRRAPSPAPQRQTIPFNVQGQKGTITYDTTIIQKKKVVVHAAIIIDASGSMGDRDSKSGDTRMQSVLLYVKLLVKDVLAPDDRITLAFFHTTYHQVFRNSKASTVLKDFDRVRAYAAAIMAVSRGTALYDNTIKAIEIMGKTESGNADADGNPVMRNLIVFSDGEDNASKATLAEVAAALRRPGFGNFSHQAIIVGAPASAAQMTQALRGVQLAKVISEGDCSAGSIGKAFGKANAAMREAKQLVERLVVQFDPRPAGAKPCMPALLHQIVAQMAPQQPKALKAQPSLLGNLGMRMKLRIEDM